LARHTVGFCDERPRASEEHLTPRRSSSVVFLGNVRGVTHKRDRTAGDPSEPFRVRQNCLGQRRAIQWN
jgi:hypothetical protein